MKVSVGLPATIPNILGGLIIDWAKKADEMGFHTLGIIDRTVYSNHEALISLAAAAAVTKKIRLMPTSLILPARDTGIVAKQIATLDSISGGRVSLGFAVGGRQEDYEINERGFKTKVRRMEKQIALMRDIWSGKKVAGNFGYVGPSPKQKGGPEILLGGYIQKSFERAGRIADGFITGGVADLGVVTSTLAGVQESWKANNRQGKPRLVCAVYYGLGENAIERAGEYLLSYYGDYGKKVIKGLQSSSQQLNETLKSFAQIGTDEMMLWPTIPEIGQLDLLRAALSPGFLS